MNKETLENNLSNLLELSDEDKKQGIELFKKKIAESLKIGEALKIEGIGIFQLKEKYSHSPGKGAEEDVKNLTILFSPENKDSLESSLFINLDIDNKAIDENEFSEDVLQIGIGKKIITDINDLDNLADDSSSVKKQIEDKIDSILNKYPKVKNFDLWDDHLKSKESTSIIEEEINEEDNLLIDEVDDKVDEDNILDEPIVELNDDELLESYVEDTNFVIDVNKTKEEFHDEFEDLETNNDEIRKNNFEDKFETTVDREELEDKIEQESEELKIDEEEVPESEKSVIDEIEKELESENISDETDIKEEVEEDIENGELIDFTTPEDEEVTEDIEELNDSEFLEVEENIEKKYHENSTQKQKSKLWIYILLPALILIAAIGIYYSFFNNGTHSFQNDQVLADESSTDNTPIVDDNVDQTEDIDQQIGEEVSANENENIKDEDDLSIQSDVNVTDKQDDSKNNVIESTSSADEREIARNIFYDGYVYNVQVSSWKSRDIAEKEVNRILNKGFPAFLIKAYIPKFDGTWHRVRIGPYTSLEEAREVQNKIK